MSTLNPKGGLAIAEIVFFAPALLVSLFIVLRHGFTKQLGWIYLVLLSLLRLIGASALLYSETQHDYSQGVLETVAITSAVGTAPLLLTLLGFMNRVHDGMKAHGGNIPDLVFRGISTLALAGLIIAIVGGTNESDPSKVSDYNTGRTLMEAGSIIFLAIFLILAAIAILTYTRKHAALSTEHKLVDAGVAALPFLLVRIVYTVIVAFSSSPSSDFFFRSVNVYVSSFMQFMMEAIVVVIFIVAGLLTPRKSPAVSREMEMPSGQDGARMEDGRYGQYQTKPQQQSRSIGDYRPSRLIRDAISGR